VSKRGTPEQWGTVFRELGLAAARSKGVRLGAPVGNDGDLAKRATKLRRGGETLQAIADRFNREGLRTVRGELFAPQTVYLMIGRVDPAANPEGGYRGKALAA
jgi:hypothetical protein